MSMLAWGSHRSLLLRWSSPGLLKRGVGRTCSRRPDFDGRAKRLLSGPGGGGKPGSKSSSSKSSSSSNNTSSSNSKGGPQHEQHEGKGGDTYTILKDAAESALADVQKRTAAISNERKKNIAALSFSGTTVVLVLFGKSMYGWFKQGVGEVAGDVLEHESIEVKTSELAAAVVQHVLNDSAVLTKSSEFIKKASKEPETLQALITLVNKILKDDAVIKEVNALIKKVFCELCKDKEVVGMTSHLLKEALKVGGAGGSAEVKISGGDNPALLRSLMADPNFQCLAMPCNLFRHGVSQPLLALP